MRCVGGACDGIDFFDWPINNACWPPAPVPYARVVNRGPLPPLLPQGAPPNEQVFITYEYKAIKLCWPDGSLRTWIAVPCELNEQDIYRLLIEKDIIDG